MTAEKKILLVLRFLASSPLTLTINAQVPMSEDGVNMPPLNESTGQYEQPSVADDDSVQESVDSTSPLV